MHKIKCLLVKYKQVILYVCFGGMTTVVNVVMYYSCYNILKVANVLSTVYAWLVAVVFAFITNKLWVFESRSFDGKVLSREISSFFGARIATGFLDILVMYFAVDLMNWNSTIWKLLGNIIVIVLNYIASKLLIFKKVSHN